MSNISKLAMIQMVSALFIVGCSSPPKVNTAAETAKPIVEQIVDTQTKIAAGPHKGFRSNHAKGIVVSGTFAPSASAADITKAPHLQKTPSEVVVRFSNATGIPNITDTSPKANPRGIAIRFKLPGDKSTDIVSFSVNRFPAASPEVFFEFLNAVAATKPDSPKPTPLEQFLETHPAAKAFVKTPKSAPASYATQSFFGVNAFKFTNAKGESRYGRYRITPLAGDRVLDEASVATASANYLSEELTARLQQGQGEAKFRITVQLADKDDVVNDATVVWPEDRQQVEVGILTLTAVLPDSKEVEKKLAFNPLSLVDGISPSDDPILLARPAAYAISVSRRAAN